MEFPIFVLAKDCGEVLKFESHDEMQRELESIDVENEEYDAWDRCGIPLRLSVSQSRDWLEILPQEGTSESAKIKTLLYDYARSIDLDPRISPSDDLVSLFNEIIGRK